MNVTQAQIEAINKILKSGKLDSDPDHFVAMLRAPFIIYGMDDPQRTYLAIATLVETALPSNSEVTSGAVATQAASDKTGSTRVSNYFIDFNKQGNVVAESGGFALKRTAEPAARDGARETARAAFSQRFEASKLGLSAAENDPLIRGVAKDNQALHKTTKPLTDLTGSLKNFAVRRACKFLLYDSIQNGVKIAYALDDMDLSKVVTKQYVALKDDDGYTVKQKVPVCTSEIREIFRNWDHLADHVIFFKGFKRVPPPWNPATGTTQEVKLWADYAAKRANKLKAKYGKSNDKLYATVKSNVERAAQNFAPKPTLDAFHASKPSLFNPKYALPVDHTAHELL